MKSDVKIVRKENLKNVLNMVEVEGAVKSDVQKVQEKSLINARLMVEE